MSVAESKVWVGHCANCGRFCRGRVYRTGWMREYDEFVECAPGRGCKKGDERE